MTLTPGGVAAPPSAPRLAADLIIPASLNMPSVSCVRVLRFTKFVLIFHSPLRALLLPAVSYTCHMHRLSQWVSSLKWFYSKQSKLGLTQELLGDSAGPEELRHGISLSCLEPFPSSHYPVCYLASNERYSKQHIITQTQKGSTVYCHVCIHKSEFIKC